MIKLLHGCKILFLTVIFFAVMMLLPGFCKSAWGQTQTFTITGSFTVPAGVTSINVECWGAGGAGGQAINTSKGKGGGGGGAYASGNVIVTPGNTYSVTVGAGGTAGEASGSTSGGQSDFLPSVIALGGINGDNNITLGTGGAGGLSSGSTGTTKYDGGNGGNGNINSGGGGGGGGSSATATGIGVNGGITNTAIGGAGGNGSDGDGGNGGDNNNSGLIGTAPGGGGGGRGDVGAFSGNGERGQVIVRWITVTALSTETCLGGSTGTITATGTGGLTPYTYSLNAGAYQVSATFTGLSAATYTIYAKDNLGCIAFTSVTVNSPAASGDVQTTAGSDLWIGHVYDGINLDNYIGHYTEPETFDQNFGGDLNCFIVTSNTIARSIYSETFSVRYRMNSSKKGLYIVDLGSDDGSRLTIDGILIYNNWSDQSFLSKPQVLMSLNGASSLVYDFYEKGGQNRVVFQNLTLVLSNNLTTNITQNICLGSSGSAISGDVYGSLPTNIALSGTGYQWSYSTIPAGVRTNIPGATDATCTPNTSIAPLNIPGTYYIYRNAVLSSANNVSPNPYIATNESNAAILTVNPNLPASVSIVASQTGAICSGTSVIFTATPTNGGITPAYQWKLNGTNVGTNISTYTNASLANGNTVSCVITSNATCPTGSPATSNTVTMTVNPNLSVSISIVPSANSVCSGTSVTFTAIPTNGGTTPAYQWKVNGANKGTNSATYSYAPVNNDAITCLLTSNATCISGNPATSNSVTMIVYSIIGQNTADYTNGIHGVICATTAENANAVLTAPAGTVFINVGFASYGTPNGTCPAFTLGGCNSLTSQTVAETYLLGNNSASIPATNAVFGDPCVGTFKRLYVTATYTQPICAGTFPGTITGSDPTGGNGSYTYLWESSTTSANSGFLAASGTNNSKGYTPGALSHTTWFRRRVTSGGCTDISTTIQIKVTPMPSATISYAGSPYCLNVGLVPVAQIGTTGGSYSATPSGLNLNAGTGEINTNTSTSGTYTVTYAIAAAGGCSSFTTTTTVSIIGDLIWTGTVSTDWNVSGNWSCGFIPTLTTLVQIPNVANKPVLSGGPVGAANNIVINIGSSLTIVGNTIQLSGTITNNGTFTATAGTIEMKGSGAQLIGANAFAGNTIKDLIINNIAGVTLQGTLNITGIVKAQNGNLFSGVYLTLLSTAAQTALIDGSGIGTVTGNVTMQRYLPSGFGYKYFSSPFQTAMVNEFSDDMDLLSSFPSFYKYDESKSSAGWVNYTNTVGVLNPLHGYAVNFGSAAPAITADATGVVSNGSLSRTMYNNNKIYTKGFNLVGNPYPSPIDWDAASGWTKTNIDNALYFFKASTTDQYGGTYSSYIGGVSTGGSSMNLIPSMQGFFIHVSNGTFPVTGTLGLNNNVRITDLTHPFTKSLGINSLPLLRLTAGFSDDTVSIDPAVIYFDEKASPGFDGNLDALKLMNTDLKVTNLYSVASDGNYLSINALPVMEDSLLIVPLGLKTARDGKITFRISDEGNLPSGKLIYLYDKVTGADQSLNLSGEYNIYLSAGEYNNRFSLRFLKSTVMPENEPFTDLFSIYSSKGTLIADISLLPGKRGTLVINNISGQILFRKEICEGGYHEFNPQLITGLYFVSFITGNARDVKKIFILNR